MKQLVIFFFHLLVSIKKINAMTSSGRTFRVFTGSLTAESTIRSDARGEGIYAFDLHITADGSALLNHSFTIPNVTSSLNLAITHDGKYLYATSYSDFIADSQIHAFQLHQNAGQPKNYERIGSWPVAAFAAVQSTVDPQDRFLFVSAFEGGAAAAFEIDPDTGRLYMRNFYQFPKPPNPSDIPGPHYSVVDANLRFVYFSGFAHDCVWRMNYSKVLGFDTSSLKVYPAPPGSGARSLELDPISGKYLYASCETTNHLLVYQVDEEGDLLEVQYEPMPLANSTSGSRAADIHASPDGRFIYVSSRHGSNTIAVFQVHENGTVKLIQEIQSGGDTPNYFTLIPELDLLLVANQNSDDITAFRTDRENGTLSRINQWLVNAPESMQVISFSTPTAPPATTPSKAAVSLSRPAKYIASFCLMFLFFVLS